MGHYKPTRSMIAGIHKFLSTPGRGGTIAGLGLVLTVVCRPFRDYSR